MVVADGRHDRHVRIHDVDRIQPATQSDFENPCFARCALEYDQGR